MPRLAGRLAPVPAGEGHRGSAGASPSQNKTWATDPWEGEASSEPSNAAARREASGLSAPSDGDFISTGKQSTDQGDGQLRPAEHDNDHERQGPS